MAIIPFLNNAYFSAKVGIGTDSPVSIVDVSNIAPTLTIGGAAVNQFESGRIRFTEAAGTSAGFQGSYIHYDGSGNKLHIGMHEVANTSVSNDVNAITILRANSYVGIGTDSPDTSLTIKTGSSAGLAKISSDGNGAVYSANGDVQFYTNNSAYAINFFSANKGSNLMHITDGGNVGIGTTSPRTKLEIGASGSLGSVTNKVISATFDGGYSTTNSLQYNVNAFIGTTFGTTDIFAQTSGEVLKNFYVGLIADNSYFNGSRYSITQGGAERFTVDQGGNVGIGTAIPNTKLEVNGNNGTAIRITIPQSSPVVGDVLSSFETFSNDTSGSIIPSVRTSISTIAEDAYARKVGLTLNTSGADGENLERVRVDGLGNVGIGISSPVAKLHVYQNDTEVDTEAGVTIEQDGAGDAALSFLLTGTKRWKMGIDNSDSDKFKISDSTNLASNNKLTIISSGNVGIGTTSPGKKLHVKETSGTYEAAIFETNSGGSFIRNIDSTGAVETGIQGGKWSARTSNTQRLVIDSSGNVGIGTTSPTQKLHVDGNTLISAEKYYYTAGTGAGIGSDASGNFKIKQNGADLIFGSGNHVGIGTTNPSTKLSIRNNGAQLSLQRADATGTEWKFYSWASGLNIFPAAASEIYIGRDGAATNLQLHNGVLKVLGTEPSYFTGNVGIGTTNPSAKLQVGSRGTAGALTPPATDGILFDFHNDGPPYTRHAAIISQAGDASESVLDFWTKASSGTSSKKVTINGTGNVGIGTTAPKAKLDINGHFCVDSKTHSITDAFTTCLTVNLDSHTGCHVVITAFGDWGSHSSAAYRGEFFLQNGANGYSEPGIILRQDDNTSDGTDQIICQIVDPTSTANPKDFEIQIRHTDTVVGGFSAQLTYTVQGKFNSIT